MNDSFLKNKNVQEALECLIQSDRYEEAFSLCCEVVRKTPEQAIGWHYLGACHFFARRFEASIEAYERALSLNPWFGWVSKFNMSQAFLMIGELEKGFELFESRLDNPKLPSRPVPKWKGEEITGKTLLVHQDEGFGDAIQFLRYIPYLKRYGCRVLLFVKPELRCLFQHLEVPLLEEKTFACDLHVETGSLPFCCKTNLSSIPPPVNISSRWKPIKGRVGLVWQASIGTMKDAGGEGIAASRSMPIEHLTPLLQISGREYVSLQKEVFPSQESFLVCYRVQRPRIESFLDTLRMLETCELVITVDTSVAHLSASMNIPTWILLPFDGSWRWFAERMDSPWYPSVRLFRQEKDKKWEGPIEQIRELLCNL